MRKLIEGILEYRRGHLPNLEARFRALAASQDPHALFVGCSDSRVVPTLMVAMEPGDLFVVRTVGNLVAPTRDGATSVGDVSEACALEYALAVLGVEDLIICGHSNCGAMKAVLSAQLPPDAPNLREWLEHARPAQTRVNDLDGKTIAHLPPHDTLSQANVLTQMDHVRSYRIVSDRETAGQLRVHGWWFDVGSGDVYAYEPSDRGFVLVDEAEGERILARTR